MGSSEVAIGDISTYRKEPVHPLPGTLYSCYSLPAFDNNRTPELLYGSEILSDKLAIKSGDILVNKLNMKFKRIWNVEHAGTNPICSTEFVPLQINEEIADRRFVYYTLLDQRFTQQMSEMRTGTSGSHQRVKPEWILNYSFNLPDLPIQQQIGSMLATIDNKWVINARINGYLAALATTIYRQFLERASSNGHEGVLSELLEIRYGKDHKKLIDGNIPVYGSGGQMRRVDSSLYKGESVLIPRKGSLNNVMYVNEEFWTVDTMFYSVPKVQGAAKYCYEFLAAKNLASMNSGSAVPSMTTRMLDALPILVPNKTDLALFDGKVSPLFSAQQILSKENNALGSLRDTLLPKLMSGEIDVSKVEVPTLPNSHLHVSGYVLS